MIKYLDLKRINDLHDAELRKAVNRVMDSGWYLKGDATRQFEQHYASYIGTKYCVGCANGLDALKLIMRAYIEMGVMHEGDEVIVPANTYIASILSITRFTALRSSASCRSFILFRSRYFIIASTRMYRNKLPFHQSLPSGK